MSVATMGDITYKIYKQVLNDEIRFKIAVTNISDREQCFILRIYDSHGKQLPDHRVAWKLDKIPAGQTEYLYIDSINDVWHIGSVEGSTVTFKLFSDPSFLGGTCNPLAREFWGFYELTDTKEFYVKKYYGDVAEKYMWFVIIIVLAYAAAKMKVWRMI